MTEVQQAFQTQTDNQWVDKTRTLIVSSRGMTGHQRIFMLNLFSLFPHAKKQFKLDKKDVSSQIEQLCQNHKCRYFLYFEVKKKINFSVWLGRYPEGPTVKLLLSGIVLNKDVKFQGNNVKNARHVLSFEKNMDSQPKMRILKELFTGAMNVPKYHPKCAPVIDHVLNFTCSKDPVSQSSQISFRNYQIFREVINKESDKLKLYEIGPRFLMDVKCILDGSMKGEVLYRAPIFKNIAQKNKTKKAPSKLDREISGGIAPVNVFGEHQEEDNENNSDFEQEEELRKQVRKILKQ